MATKSRFYKSTKGFNAEVIVAKAVAYTTDATYDLFVANAVDGEIGVYNADTGALISTAIADGTRYFIAQKRDGGVHKFTTIVANAGTVKRTAYTAPVKQVTTVTYAGTIGTEFKAGDVILLKVIETTPGHEQFPNITYDYDVKAGDTVTSIAAGLVAKINNLSSHQHSDGQAFVTASNAAGVLTLTAIYFGSSFRVASPGVAYENSVASVVYTTDFKLGSGFAEQIAAWEVEGQIYDGVTTQYPGGVFAPSDFGSSTAYADSTKNYHIYHFTPVRNEKSPTPVNQHHHYWNGVLAVPSAGGPATSLTTVFGV